MKALIADGKGGGQVQEVKDLAVRDTFIRIKVRGIALNPTDYKHVFNYATGGEIIGCDVAGIVESIGAAVTCKVKIGDRVAGLVHGCNSYSPRDGGFAEYAEIKDGIFAHVPEQWTWGQGATLGAGITTSAQGLFQSLGLPWPDSPAKTPWPVLIYGGSTATGCLAIQFAALAGLKVITLASAREFSRLERLGATICYDYHDADIGKKIRDDTNNELMYAFDILTNEQSMSICADALSSNGQDGVVPKVTLLLPNHTFPRDDVEVHLTSGYSIIGETSIKYGKVVEGDAADWEFGKKFWALASTLIADGKLKPHDTELRPGGLDGVIKGLHDLQNGVVKGHKLVFEL